MPGKPNFPNRILYHGDNLPFLRGMNSETVHLIATDPPFNKNKDFHATPASLAEGAQFEDRWSWRDDVQPEWLKSIGEDYPEVWVVIQAAKTTYSDGMAAFLCWLGVRLLEMHRILRPDGSLYLHIDHSAHAWTKCLLDGIFGRKQFRNEIVWRRTHSKNAVESRYGVNHDTLLYYVKSGKAPFNKKAAMRPFEDVPAGYTKDSNGRYYAYSPVYGDGASKGDSGKPAMFRGVEYQCPKGRHWRVPGGRKKGETTSAGWARLDAEGRMYVARGGKLPMYIRYLDEMAGIALDDVWPDIPIPSVNEDMGYPTQKPLALYERIIKASSSSGDIVLDPFCGCATTPVAAERLGRQWVGMDLWDGAHQIVIDRLNDSRQLLTGIPPDVAYSTTPPRRTDTGETAALQLVTPVGRRQQRQPAPRTQHKTLLADIGAFCQGCGRDYNDDPRVLEVDHIRPRSDDGSDALDNLTLLCPPCNRAKADKITLSGLQLQNRKEGHLTPEREGNIRHGRGGRPPARRR